MIPTFTAKQLFAECPEARSKCVDPVPLFVGPPFGNWPWIASLLGASPILGSFTAEPRGTWLDRVAAALTTLRPSDGGWLNRMELRNPGIDEGVRRYVPGAVLSVVANSRDDIEQIARRVPPTIPLELNISCPNTAESPLLPSDGARLLRIVGGPISRRSVTLKVPGNFSGDDVTRWTSVGFKRFHCGNGRRTDRGALSGPPILATNYALVSRVRERCPTCFIIGGGGIRTQKDVELYCEVGADAVAISTLLLHPFQLAQFMWSRSDTNTHK